MLQNLPEIIVISCDNDLHLCREYFLKNIGKSHTHTHTQSNSCLAAKYKQKVREGGGYVTDYTVFYLHCVEGRMWNKCYSKLKFSLHSVLFTKTVSLRSNKQCEICFLPYEIFEEAIKKYFKSYTVYLFVY